MWYPFTGKVKISTTNHTNSTNKKEIGRSDWEKAKVSGSPLNHEIPPFPALIRVIRVIRGFYFQPWAFFSAHLIFQKSADSSRGYFFFP